MMKIFIVTLFIVAGIGHQSLFRLAQAPKEPGSQGDTIEVLDLAGLLQLRGMRDSILIDTRTKKQYEAGHIEQARSLPHDAQTKLPDGEIDMLRKAQVVILYCDSSGCGNVYKIGNRLRELGIGTIYVYTGGFTEWKACGLPMKKGAAES
jgi:rhodanese-related sulfurtransferase